MPTRYRTFALLLTLAALVAATAVPAQASTACAGAEYAYAGVESVPAVAGVGATLTVAGEPAVFSGHVAAWIGVGGAGAAEGGDEWLQVGFSSFPGTSLTSLYMEVASPGKASSYTLLESGLAPGATRDVAAAELKGRRDWWQVTVDGRPAGDPVHLQGSDRRWQATATGESWNAGAHVCNGFRYRFDRVRTIASRGAAWRRLTTITSFRDAGYRVERPAPGSFVVSRDA